MKLMECVWTGAEGTICLCVCGCVCAYVCEDRNGGRELQEKNYTGESDCRPSSHRGREVQEGMERQGGAGVIEGEERGLMGERHCTILVL